MAEIRILTNGPNMLAANDLKLVDTNGKEIALPEGDNVFLCRCGQSENKPFCDGTHSKVGFKHDPTA